MIQRDFMAVRSQWPVLLRGAGSTLALSAVAAVPCRAVPCRAVPGVGVGCG